MTSSRPLRLGVIGCGWIMRSIYEPALRALAERGRVVAVCDLDAALAAETAGRFPGAASHVDAEAMLREAGLDAALVLTSEKANARMAWLAAEADVAVYLEKPPAMNPAELEELIAVEECASAPIYTAFNRRHTPLFSQLDFSGKKWRRVSGALKRRGREVAKFPHTAIHLLDSAQYFAGSPFQEWETNFEKKAGTPRWAIDGRLAHGAACALEFVPDGKEFSEFLILETETESWELSFPNADAAAPGGEIVFRSGGGSPGTATRGEKALPFFEAMGFRACLEDFFQRLEKPGTESAHGLSSCRATIAVMEEMAARARD